MNTKPYSVAFFLILLWLILCGSAHAGDSACDGSTQMHINRCSFEEFLVAEKEMSSLLEEQRSYLETESRGLLDRSQQAWLIYKDSACVYEVGLLDPAVPPGTMFPFMSNNCKTALIKQRIETLKSYVECRANGCPF